MLLKTYYLHLEIVEFTYEIIMGVCEFMHLKYLKFTPPCIKLEFCCGLSVNGNCFWLMMMSF